MPILKNCEIWFAKLNPSRPNARFSKENPTWEIQLRTKDKAQKKMWEELKLPVKAVLPDEGEPYFRLNLRKKSIKKDKTPADPVTVVRGDLSPVDPNSIGNGSIGNIRIFQYEYPKDGGGTGTASILMAIQLTKHIEYEATHADDFDMEETETVPMSVGSADDDTSGEY